MSRPEMERALWAILDTLKEYADDLVLIGGWVPHLHLTYGSAAGGGAHTSLTAEADLVVPVGLHRGKRRPIAQILEEAGFHPLGRTRVVWAREPEHGETIEFLQSHRGPAGSRGEAAPIFEQPGLRAFSLDRLWVLEAGWKDALHAFDSVAR